MGREGATTQPNWWCSGFRRCTRAGSGAGHWHRPLGMVRISSPPISRRVQAHDGAGAARRARKHGGRVWGSPVVGGKDLFGCPTCAAQRGARPSLRRANGVGLKEDGDVRAGRGRAARRRARAEVERIEGTAFPWPPKKSPNQSPAPPTLNTAAPSLLVRLRPRRAPRVSPHGQGRERPISPTPSPSRRRRPWPPPPSSAQASTPLR